MKIIFSTCSEDELWRFVATHLKKKGIDTILVGGAVVSIYSEGAYRSGDLDFVLNTFLRDGLDEAMAEIGFVKKGTRHFIHPECKHLFVEFPGGPPLGIGEDYTIIPDEIDSEGVKIKILSPTDCVKDRLSNYIHFRSRECFDQAVLVARKHPINFESVKKWCEGEFSPSTFEALVEKLKS